MRGLEIDHVIAGPMRGPQINCNGRGQHSTFNTQRAESVKSSCYCISNVVTYTAGNSETFAGVAIVPNDNSFVSSGLWYAFCILSIMQCTFCTKGFSQPDVGESHKYLSTHSLLYFTMLRTVLHIYDQCTAPYCTVINNFMHSSVRRTGLNNKPAGFQRAM